MRPRANLRLLGRRGEHAELCDHVVKFCAHVVARVRLNWIASMFAQAMQATEPPELLAEAIFDGVNRFCRLATPTPRSEQLG
jgi:hypothetical protein